MDPSEWLSPAPARGHSVRVRAGVVPAVPASLQPHHPPHRVPGTAGPSSFSHDHRTLAFLQPGAWCVQSSKRWRCTDGGLTRFLSGASTMSAIMGVLG
ncbi:hypothetical protein TNIN_374221, partial [Trichonephila inaurata madagascariensis]